MFSWEQISTITLLAITISMSPGPGALQAVFTGMNYGWLQAEMSIMGLQCGYLAHLLLVAFGFGYIKTYASGLIDFVHYAGVVYLIYLGAKIISSKGKINFQNKKKQNNEGGSGIFTKSMLINFTNPKSLIFMFAVIPQFVDFSGSIPTQALILGTVFVICDVVVMHGYVSLGKSTGMLTKRPELITIMNRILGSIVIIMALFLLSEKF